MAPIHICPAKFSCHTKKRNRRVPSRTLGQLLRRDIFRCCRSRRLDLIQRYLRQTDKMQRARDKRTLDRTRHKTQSLLLQQRFECHQSHTKVQKIVSWILVFDYRSPYKFAHFVTYDYQRDCKFLLVCQIRQ